MVSLTHARPPLVSPPFLQLRKLRLCFSARPTVPAAHSSSDDDTDMEGAQAPAATTTMRAGTAETEAALAAAIGSIANVPLTFQSTYSGKKGSMDAADVKFVIGVEFTPTARGPLKRGHLCVVHYAHIWYL